MQTPVSGVTFRSLLAGALIAFCISVGAPYGNMVLRGSYMALDFSTAGAIFLFFVFVFFVHTFLGLLHPRLAFHRQELAVVHNGHRRLRDPYDGSHRIPAPHYQRRRLLRQPRKRVEPTDSPLHTDLAGPTGLRSGQVFYEGAPRNYALPWAVWLKPLVAWVPLILSIYFSMICISVVLRRQWIVRERLAFLSYRCPWP